MRILDELASHEAWLAFHSYKAEKARLSQGELDALFDWISRREYLPLAQAIQAGASFAPPTKKLVNKSGTGKKRVVYSFGESETMLLKLMAFLLYRYDHLQAPNCYSFRRDRGAKQAIRSLAGQKGISGMWCYKLDVHNYFNSIHIPTLLPILEGVLEDDPALYAFLEALLTTDQAYENGTLVQEPRGAMAGTPISPFLANLYLMELDQHFVNLGLPYARYSDDIILFAPDEETLRRCQTTLACFLSRYGLRVNPDKESVTPPGEAWEFLGICYQNGQIDLSRATMNKLKGKIRRKARALYRWKCKKHADDAAVLRAFARALNRKFFENPRGNEFTWARWFFPLLTRTDGLAAMDAYIQQALRYACTGRHSKANFRIDYKMLKAGGYRSLVNEYYRFKRQSSSPFLRL